jgi:hypothetical protein
MFTLMVFLQNCTAFRYVLSLLYVNHSIHLSATSVKDFPLSCYIKIGLLAYIETPAHFYLNIGCRIDDVVVRGFIAVPSINS